MNAHLIRCKCGAEATLPGCGRCTPTPECFRQSTAVIEAFIERHVGCEQIEVHAHGVISSITVEEYRKQAALLPPKLPFLQCEVCGKREPVPVLPGPDFERIASRIIEMFCSKHEDCGCIGLYTGDGERVVSYERPGYRDQCIVDTSRAARDLVSQHPTRMIACPTGCGGTITLELAKAFSPGSVTVCDKCGAEIRAQGAFDQHGNRL